MTYNNSIVEDKDYKIVAVDKEKDRFGVVILEGDYKDVLVSIEKLEVIEENENKYRLEVDYQVINNDDLVENNEEFNSLMTEIFNQFLQKAVNLAQKELNENRE